MRARRLAALAAGAAALAALVYVGATEVSRTRVMDVFAAASLSDAFGEIGHAFERLHPGMKVQVNLAGSQRLAMQIEQGAKADVFASADERWMNHLDWRGRLAGVPVVFARNMMVVIVPKSNPGHIHELPDLARSGVKLVLGADAVPAGRYARAVLRRLSSDPAFGPGFSRRALANVVSEEENVKSVVGKVQLGEADAGIVYRSDVTATVAPSVSVMEIPGRANVLTSCPIALLRGAKHAAAARAFIGFVRSGEGQKILERNGFIPTGPAR